MSFLHKVLSHYVLAGDVVNFQAFKDKKAAESKPVKPAEKPIKSNPANDKKLVLKLQKLLHAEHVDQCHDNPSCDVNFAAECGYYYWAIDLFAGSGAASEEYEALYKQLSPAFFKEAEKERKQMCEEPHTECKKCNAVNWGDDVSHCGSCDKPLEVKAAADDIKRGDKVISFHVDPDLPHFIIGQIVGIQEDWPADGTTRYILKGEYDVNARGGKIEVKPLTHRDNFYPPVNGTPSSDGSVLNNVRKIG